MQRALSYAQSPDLGIPLRFLLTAPCFAALAGLLLLWYGEAALDSRWTAPALAATHLLTLGVLSMAMAGSILQLLPVVAGQTLVAPRWTGTLAWFGLTAAALTLAAAFLTGPGWLFVAGGVAAAVAVAALAAGIAAALLRPAPPGSLPMVAGMRLALPALVVTTALGLALAVTLAGGPQVALLLATDLHVAWGLVGWVAMLVVGVGFQVIPMFVGVPAYPAALTRLVAPLMGALLLAWTASHWFELPIAVAAGMLLALLLAGFGLYSLRQMARPGKKAADGTKLYWRLSLACLAASALGYCVPVMHGWQPMALGIVFICGFAIGAVNGMLYKIVPFLLWYHLQQNPLAGKGDVPSIRVLLPEAAGRRQFLAYALALATVLAALWWPHTLARPAGALFAAASMLLAVDLARATLRYRAVLKRIQPS